MDHRIFKSTRINFFIWIRNIKDGITILPYLCLDKNCCSGEWEINFGWIVLGFRITFKK